MSAEERIGTLESALRDLAYAGRRTEMSLDRLIQESEERAKRWDAEFARKNQEWGALANKMGTFVEDMVLPNFPRILERYFGVDSVERLLPRPRVTRPGHPGDQREFDLLAWTADTVFWNETKAKAAQNEFKAFVKDTGTVFEYFPELRGRRLVKIASALYIAPEMVDYLTKNGCYAMMLGEETMDIVNFDDVSKRSPPRDLQ